MITRRRRRAATWVASDDESYAYSFRNVCMFLDLDPAAVRAACDTPSATRVVC